jgi:hypothetical protein
MGKFQKYLYDFSQTFTNITALKIMNMYQILSVYLITTKFMAKKLADPGNRERPICHLICNRIHLTQRFTQGFTPFPHNLHFVCTASMSMAKSRLYRRR